MKKFSALLFLAVIPLCALAEDPLPASTQSPGDMLSQTLFMMAVLFGIFYFLLIRPQQKQQKKHKDRIEALKKGDKIIGAGGIFGTIIGINEEKAVIKIGENVKIEILKDSITTILGEEKE